MPNRNGEGDLIDMLAYLGRLAANAVILAVVGGIFLICALIYFAAIWIYDAMKAVIDWTVNAVSSFDTWLGDNVLQLCAVALTVTAIFIFCKIYKRKSPAYNLTVVTLTLLLLIGLNHHSLYNFFTHSDGNVVSSTEAVVSSQKAQNASGVPQGADEFLKQNHVEAPAINAVPVNKASQDGVSVPAGTSPIKTAEPPEARLKPVSDDSVKAASHAQPDCSVSFPCRLQAIIDDKDWEAVASAIGFAMQANIAEKINWTSKEHNHKGYVQRVGGDVDGSSCKRFKVVSFMGTETGRKEVSACQGDGGVITFK